MRELVGGKNTIGRTAAVLKKPHKAKFTFTFYLHLEAELRMSGAIPLSPYTPSCCGQGKTLPFII